jgi:hypothetical protein
MTHEGGGLKSVTFYLNDPLTYFGLQMYFIPFFEIVSTIQIQSKWRSESLTSESCHIDRPHITAEGVNPIKAN